jgi:peroxiredoxin
VQLVELQDMWNEFEERDIHVIAIAQEDTDLESHGRFPRGFDGPVPFDIVADLKREATLGYDRTTAYLIDKRGIVRQVFPTIIHARPSWKAVLHEADRILAQPSGGTSAAEAGAGK